MPDTTQLATRGGKGGEGLAVARVNDQNDAQDIQDVRQWLEGIGATADIQIRIKRMQPKAYDGVPIEGSLETVEEFIDDEWLKDRYGGGTYQLNVMKRAKNGSMQYHTSRTVKIAGPPNMSQYGGAGPTGRAMSVSPPSANNDLASQALSMTQRQLELEQQRNAGNRGTDPALLQAITAPMQAALADQRAAAAEARRESAAKDERIFALIAAQNAPRVDKADEFKDKILSNMLEGESARIEALRERHESEMRQLREGHRQEIDRVRANAADDMRAREKQHERELDMMRSSYKTGEESKKISWETRIDGLQAEIKRLERDAIADKTQIAKLQAIKEKPVAEQAAELMKLKETLGDAFGDRDDDDAEEGPWYKTLMRAVAENPEAIGQMLGGVRQNLPGGAPQVQQQLAAPNPAVVRRPIPPGMRRRKRRHAAAAPELPHGGLPGSAPPVTPAAPATASTAAPGPAIPPAVRAPDENEMAMAVMFLEQAVGGDPAAFAASAKDVVPADIFNYIAAMGVDAFLDSVPLMDESPLKTLRGKKFVRAVFEHLAAG